MLLRSRLLRLPCLLPRLPPALQHRSPSLPVHPRTVPSRSGHPSLLRFRKQSPPQQDPEHHSRSLQGSHTPPTVPVLPSHNTLPDLLFLPTLFPDRNRRSPLSHQRYPNRRLRSCLHRRSQMAQPLRPDPPARLPAPTIRKAPVLLLPFPLRKPHRHLRSFPIRKKPRHLHPAHCLQAVRLPPVLHLLLPGFRRKPPSQTGHTPASERIFPEKQYLPDRSEVQIPSDRKLFRNPSMSPLCIPRYLPDNLPHPVAVPFHLPPADHPLRRKRCNLRKCLPVQLLSVYPRGRHPKSLLRL